MDFLKGGGDDSLALAKPSAAAKRAGALGFNAADEDEETDMFGEFNADDLDTMDGPAAAVDNKEPGEQAEVNETVKEEPPRMVRPPLHPGKPIAAGEQQMQASSSPSVTDAKESRSSDADPPSSLARQLEGPTSAVQTADPCHTKLLTDAAMATPMVTENLPNVPAPVLPTNPGVTDQLMDGTAAATAPATGKAAASLEPKTALSTEQATAPPDPGQSVEAAHVEPSPPAGQANDQHAPLGRAVSMPRAVPGPAHQHMTAKAPAAQAKPITSSKPPPLKPANLLPAIAPAPTSKPSASLSAPFAVPGSLTGGTILSGSATFQPSMLSAKPLPASSTGRIPSKPNAQASHLRTVLPALRMPAAHVLASGKHQLTTALRLQQQPSAHVGTPGSAPSKQLLPTAHKSSTASPIPVGPPVGPPEPAAPSVGQQTARAEAARAAMLADEMLTFDFAGTVAAVLDGHDSRMGDSDAASQPMAEEVQQQLQELEQLGLQAEAVRRKIGSLSVDLAVYRSALAFMDTPAQAGIFANAVGKAEALWADVSSYELPFIPGLQPAQSEVDELAADAARLAGEGKDRTPVQPGVLEIAFSSCEDSADVMADVIVDQDDGASMDQGVQETPPDADEPDEHMVPHPTENDASMPGTDAFKETAVPKLLPDTEPVMVAATQEVAASAAGPQQMEVDTAGMSVMLTATADRVLLSMEMC